MSDLDLEQPLRRRGIYLLPNLFTTGALFAGFYAIVAAMKGQFDAAAIAIFVAMVMDGLDGRVARLTGTQSAFGAQYDSLSDMVSFGVTPALVVYSWGLQYLGKLGWLAAFIYAAATALRLARFNIQIGSADKRYFIGLPSPAAAAVVAGMVWICTENLITGQHISELIALITVALGVLMVSNCRYYSFKEIDFKGNVPFVTVLFVLFAYILIAWDPPTILFSVFTLYALSGPLSWVRHYFKKKPGPLYLSEVKELKQETVEPK
jgi:CDP-diacylglycerol--serine O-phosphatidyltransferase